MKRDKKIDIADVEVDMQVRLTRRHEDGWATETYEGRVVALHWERNRRGIIGNTPLPDQISAIEGVGDRIYHWREGWQLWSIETTLPPLPTTAGSIVLCGQRAAVLREGMDPLMRSDEPTKEWIWTDVLGYQQHDRGPTEEMLASAEILHDAGRRA